MHPWKSRPTLGVVLGIGCVKAFAAIPVFEFLEENHMPIDFIVGGSGGAMIGALWASSRSMDKVLEGCHRIQNDDYLSKYNLKRILGLINFPYLSIDETQGIMDVSLLQRRMEAQFGGVSIEDLPIRLTIKATDLYDGTSVNITQGPLWKAVYASSAVYPFMPAMQINGRYLVDAAYSMPLGVSDLMQASIDLGIIISFPSPKVEKANDPLNYFTNSLTKAHESMARHSLATAMALFPGEAIYIEMALKFAGSIFDPNKTYEMMELGRRFLAPKRSEILRIYNELSEKKETET